MNVQASSNKNQNTIAVLPFVNLSGEADYEYFCDGITEEIINALTKVGGLKVIARTSAFAFKNKNIDVRSIGSQLGVIAVIEGSVRKTNDKLRITAQLINTQDGTHLWSNNFNYKLQDLFDLQDDVSLAISEHVRENFGHIEIQNHLVEAPTKNINAYSLYLKGRHHQLKWSKNDLLKAVEYYKLSLTEDPSFSLPYFGVGLTLGILAAWEFMPYKEGIQSADDYLKQGLQKDDRNYLGYFALATVYFWGKWDFVTAQKNFLKSLKLNLSFTDTEEGLSELYTANGKFDDALAHVNHILSLNPLSPNHYYTKANIFYLQNKFEQAISILDSALKIDPGFSLAIELIAASLIHLGDFESLEAFLAEKNNLLEYPEKCKVLFHLKNKTNDNKLGFEKYRNLIKTSHSSLIPWDLYLQVYMGNHKLAIDILEEGINKRKGQYINFAHDPFLKPLHSHKRFSSLVESTFKHDLLPEVESLIDKPDLCDKAFLSNKESEQLLADLYQILETEKLFLRPELSLKSLAAKLSTHPNKLSWLINEKVGKNFNEFINMYRLETFKDKALNPSNSHLTLLGLAYESGFNSKSVFNSFFKKIEGESPSRWIKLNR